MIHLFQKIDGSVFALAVLAVLAFKVARAGERATLQLRLFRAMLGITAAELVLDIFTLALDGNPGTRTWLTLVHLLYFFIQPLSSYSWSLYADYLIFSDAKRLGRVALILSPPILLHSVWVLATPATGWIFRLDAANVYSRGSLFPFSAAIPFLYLSYTLVSALLHLRRIPERNRFPVLFFAVPPTVAGAAQSAFYGLNLLWPGVTVSLLMIYLNIESELLSTDHLTGLQNRRSFEQNLSRKLKVQQADRPFALLMLDLNGFKQINDRFGHAAGDEALAETANVLRRCLHANDFIARYAGDEFVVIADIQREEDAATLRSRVEQSFAAFNARSLKPWKLSASIGAAVRRPGSAQSAAELTAEADRNMYREKAAAKAAEA